MDNPVIVLIICSSVLIVIWSSDWFYNRKKKKYFKDSRVGKLIWKEEGFGIKSSKFFIYELDNGNYLYRTVHYINRDKKKMIEERELDFEEAQELIKSFYR